MSIQRNVNKLLDGNFNNNTYLPKKIALEDLDNGVMDFIKNLNISVSDEDGNPDLVPVIFLTQERWAEYKKNWKFLKDESFEEIVMPFIVVVRNSVKQGTNPLKRTIPRKNKFMFSKVPIFDGTVKGYELYKIPQPTLIDVEYETRFLTHYMQDVNVFYENILNTFSDLQAYLKINGYDIPIKMGDPSENHTMDNIDADRKFEISVPITMYGKLVDPSNFEKVNTITRIAVSISEKR